MFPNRSLHNSIKVLDLLCLYVVSCSSGFWHCHKGLMQEKLAQVCISIRSYSDLSSFTLLVYLGSTIII